MSRPVALREPMDMPEPAFPIKMSRTRFSVRGQMAFPLHWHSHLELLFVETGELLADINSTPCLIRPGELAVVNSNDLHQGTNAAGDGNLVYYVVIADASLLQSRTQDAVETKYIAPMFRNRLLFQNKIGRDTHAAGCMSDLIRELEQKSPGYELAVKSHMFRLLAALARQHVAQAAADDDSRQRMAKLERFAPVFRYMEERCAEPLSVGMLADLAGLSRYHFSRLFRELTNRTVTEYINQLRVHKADELLNATDKTVSEIALEVGFNDMSYFSRVFKKHRGVSPSRGRSGR